MLKCRTFIGIKVMIKKILTPLLALLLITPVFADDTSSGQSMNMSNSSNAKDIEAMYFNFGLGIGGASGWTSGASTAINAMTMGVYLDKYFGIEAGMDVLPEGSSDAGQAMIMSYHLAAKGVLPLANVFSLYAKAGLGINQYEGEAPSDMGMAMANQVGYGLYYAGGAMFNFNRNFSIYLEGSGIADPNLGNNANPAVGNFGSTYMGTLGLEFRI